MSQQQELTRVKQSIGRLVEEFVMNRLQTGQPRFHMEDLHAYILAQVLTAPASTDRILRQLRLDGKINYRVINRAESCYEIITESTSETPKVESSVV